MIEKSYEKLKAYCEAEGYMGWDPYDGLNSKFFRRLPFASDARLVRLAWIQLFKRSPFNLRRITGVRKEYNAKGLGLFLSGYCNLYKISPDDKILQTICFLSGKLSELQNLSWSGSCWGYNFDWQARAFFQPKNTPTVVATTFVANALLDAYEILADQSLLAQARSACDFVLKDLNRTFDTDGDFCFSYSPLDHSVVYNASLLGSKLLSRVYSFTSEPELIDEAKRSVMFSCKRQRQDGSWSYGELPFHQWIDNFHTGYNLECISDYIKFSGDNGCVENLKRGYRYYIDTFFTKEGKSKYFNNKTYPIDIHAPAQLVVTLVKLGTFLKDKDLVDGVLKWTIRNMQDEKGFFYFQVKKYGASKIPYMRWAQAWMFYALSTYLFEISSPT